MANKQRQKDLKKEIDKSLEIMEEAQKIEQKIKDISKNAHKKGYSKDYINEQKRDLERLEYIISLNKYNIFLLDRFEYINTKLDKYIKVLKQTQKDVKEMFNKTDLTSEEVNRQLEQFKKDYIKYYVVEIESGNFDVYDEKQRHIFSERLADALISIQLEDIEEQGFKDFADKDLSNKQIRSNYFVNYDTLKTIQDYIKDKTTKELKLYDDKELIKKLIKIEYKINFKKITDDINDIENIEYYKQQHQKYLEIDKLKNEIQQDLQILLSKTSDIELKDNNNYDVVKFKTSDDIVSKIDPIAKNILSGKKFEIGKLIKTSNNYNDKTYGAIFSIKTADLSNIDIIEELQQKGIQINHFGKKLIDDIDILLDENKGNVNNNDKLVALTPKMIAKKVYNTKQPTKKQINEIESYLNYLNNIYLFFVKDDASSINIERLVHLKDKGLEFLQDKEGNILNIGDALDDNIILNAKRGWSAKYQSFVYVFDNKSIFARVNQIINNDLGKQLLLSLQDKSNEIFNDYNKNVNNIIVGIRYLLFTRVNQIKHSIENDQTINKEILLSNIYNEYNITTPKQKKNIRDIIKNVLNYWIDINYIISYEFLDKEGNKIPKKSTKEVHKVYLNVNAIQRQKES